MNCSRCGFPLGTQQGFCPRCGAAYLAAHQISENTQMFETARELGFKRMELTDGFDFAWSWNLQ